MAPTWLEAAINGPWGRGRQPGIPITMAEIVSDGIAAAKAGAAIIHLHVYDEESGRQTDEWHVYARAIEAIRSEVDAIVYPTIPIAGSGFAGASTSTSGRYAHLDELGRRGLVEWGVLDPGSVNFMASDDVANGQAGFVYQNPEEHIREGLAIAARHGLHPSFAIYEPGFTRAGQALAALYPGLPTPIYRFMFSDAFLWGFRPEPWALDAHLAQLKALAPGAPAMVAGLRVEIAPLVSVAVARGVHVRVGLEDAPFGEPRSNAVLVTEAVKLIEASGGTVASAADVRHALRQA
jgi:3-keto-5-aminohexanoate cleavage enzyme